MARRSCFRRIYRNQAELKNSLWTGGSGTTKAKIIVSPTLVFLAVLAVFPDIHQRPLQRLPTVGFDGPGGVGGVLLHQPEEKLEIYVSFPRGGVIVLFTPVVVDVRLADERAQLSEPFLHSH